MQIKRIEKFYQQNKKEKNTNPSFGTIFSDFPIAVEAGVNKVCNLVPLHSGTGKKACFYCPNHFLNERGSDIVMPLALWEKMLKDLLAIDFNGYVHFQRYNEPTFLKNLEKYIKMTKDILPKVTTELFTNGTLLTKERLISLKETPLDKIIVTQQAPTKSGFMERLKDIPYDLLDNVDVRYWNDMKLVNRSGVFGELKEPLTEPCYSVHTNLAVESDGKVPLCIDDAYDEIILGDINHETIGEIWTKPSTRKLIEMLDNGNRKDISICKNCDRTIENRANSADFSKNSASYRKWLIENYGDAHLKESESEELERIAEFKRFMSTIGN